MGLGAAWRPGVFIRPAPSQRPCCRLGRAWGCELRVPLPLRGTRQSFSGAKKLALRSQPIRARGLRGQAPPRCPSGAAAALTCPSPFAGLLHGSDENLTG